MAFTELNFWLLSPIWGLYTIKFTAQSLLELAGIHITSPFTLIDSMMDVGGVLLVRLEGPRPPNRPRVPKRGCQLQSVKSARWIRTVVKIPQVCSATGWTLNPWGWYPVRLPDRGTPSTTSSGWSGRATGTWNGPTRPEMLRAPVRTIAFVFGMLALKLAFITLHVPGMPAYGKLDKKSVYSY